MPDRRQFLRVAASCAAAFVLPARADPKGPPLADMHSHYGMITRRFGTARLGEEMRANDARLVAWKLVADARWIRGTRTGIEQFREPAPGELSAWFHGRLDAMRAHLASEGLKAVLAKADVDAALRDGGGVVLASEGADFLEGKVAALDAVHAKGLRHLQLVHYIRTPVGDFQTVAPVHGGLSAMGKELVAACGDKGILVDLAHCTEQAVAQALDVARVPMVWSHGWVDESPGHWEDRFGFLRRRLSLASARRIAAKGGVIGLWALGLSRPGVGWSVTARDRRAYAAELAKLVDRVGADHVAFGTDIEGVGTNWAVDDYAGVREVVHHLEELKLPASVIERVAFRNYARVLREALPA